MYAGTDRVDDDDDDNKIDDDDDDVLIWMIELNQHCFDDVDDDEC